MCLVPVASVAFLQKTRFGISNRENGAVKTQGKQAALFPDSEVFNQLTIAQVHDWTLL